jgi:HlyD family secretion protein
LAERILQLSEEIIGLSEQVGSKAREIDLIRQELVGVNELYQKNLIPLSRLTALQREETRLTGERGQIIAQIASARGKISETELQILNIAKDMQTEVTRDLREVEAKTAELRERRVAAEDQLRRIVLHSPVSGVVHQLSVHTLGGVIQAGEQLMLIVPQDDTLSVEARVSPVDIDPIKIGGLAHLKFVAFDQRKTPELSGRIAMISADIVQQQTQSQQMPFYNVRIELPKSEVDKLGGQRIVPGMPVEVFIATTERSAFSYFMKPLSDQFARTFKDK